MPRVILALLVGALVAGCGSSSTPAGSGQTTAAPAKPRQPTSAVVSIRNFDFHPPVLTLRRGTTVRWRNRDAANHTVTGQRGASFDLGNVDPGETVSMRFGRPGVFRYVCQYHPNMRGRIIVR